MKFSLKKEDKKAQHAVKDPLEVELELRNNNDSLTITIEEVQFNPWDYIRVVNVSGEPEYQAKKDEKVIVGHRGNPILGNKHPMMNKTMKERDRVIEENKKDLDADIAIAGPIWKELKKIAHDIVENKQKIAISCHCAPAQCHTESYIPVVIDMVNNLLKETQNIPSNKKLEPPRPKVRGFLLQQKQPLTSQK